MTTKTSDVAVASAWERACMLKSLKLAIASKGTMVKSWVRDGHFLTVTIYDPILPARKRAR